MKAFMDKDFLLETETAKHLFHDYAEKMPLSENFLQKRLFYELYSEVNHYYDAHVTVHAPAVERMAKNLAAYLP